MAQLIPLGFISLFIGGVGYLSWTRPKRPYPPTGYALGTIRGSQCVMGLGVLLIVIGVFGAIIQWLF